MQAEKSRLAVEAVEALRREVEKEAQEQRRRQEEADAQAQAREQEEREEKERRREEEQVRTGEIGTGLLTIAAGDEMKDGSWRAREREREGGRGGVGDRRGATGAQVASINPGAKRSYREKR